MVKKKRQPKKDKRTKSSIQSLADRLSKTPHRLNLIILVLCILGVYANSLSGDFVQDDISRWKDTSWVEDTPFLTLISRFFIPHGGQYRPIPYTLHVMDYHLWGLNPVGFHITNTLCHIMVVIFVYLIGLKILVHRFAAFIASLLFAVHPVHTEAVSFIAGRTDVIMGVFFLISFFFYAKFRSVSGRKRYIYYAVYVFSFILALMSKEAAIALPLILILYEFCFYPPKNKKLSTVLLTLGPPLVPLVAVVGLYLMVQGTRGAAEYFIANQVGLESQVLTAIRAYYYYLDRLILPINLCLSHDFPWSSSFNQPDASYALLAIILLVVALGLTRRFSKIAFFSVGWVVLTILPISNLVAILPIPLLGERYAYVPSAGFCLILAFIIYKICNIRYHGRITSTMWAVGILLFLTFTIAYSYTTVKRNLDWANQFTITLKSVQQKPKSYYGQITLATLYYKNMEFEEAARHYQEAVAIAPNMLEGRGGLAATYYMQREYTKAIRELEDIIILNSAHMDRCNNYEATYYSMSLLKENRVKSHFLLGKIFFELGEYEKAEHHLTLAKDLKPDSEAAELLKKLNSNETW